MKKILSVFLLTLIYINVFGHDIEINGICYNLDNINKTAEVTYKGDSYVYSELSYSGDVIIPETIKYNGIIYTVTSIGAHSFNNCLGLYSVTMPNSIIKIGKEAFCFSESISSIQLPNYLEEIGDGAFRTCTLLSSVYIPESVINIGLNPFANCNSLINISVDVSNPVYDSRNDCNAIIESKTNTIVSGCKKTIIPNSIKRIGDDAFFAIDGLTNITIPNSVTSIGNRAFCSCFVLQSITIPNSVTNLGDMVFCNCDKLKSVILGTSINHIGSGLFAYNGGLESIVCLAKEVPNVKDNSWGNILQNNITLYVPKGCCDIYKSTTPWNVFGKIEEISFKLSLTDETPSLTSNVYYKSNISYTRTTTIGKYSTFCLPFDIDLSTLSSLGKVYVPANFCLYNTSTGMLQLLFNNVDMNSKIQAGTPFLVKCNADNLSFTNSSDVIYDYIVNEPTPVKLTVYDNNGSILTKNTDMEVLIGGSYSKQTNLDKTKYRAFNTNGSFGPTTWLNPFRMYVYKDDYSSPAKISSISFVFDDDATTSICGIKEVDTAKEKTYNIAGQRVSANAKGFLIKNGKKMIMR